MPELKGQFSVDIEHLHKLGVKDPNAPKSLEIFKSGQLSSDERLYFSLWSSPLLHSIAIAARKKLLSKGEHLHSAYFIVRGALLLSLHSLAPSPAHAAG